MRIAALLAAALFASLPAASMAQEGEPVRLRGTIDAVNGNVLSFTTREGEKIEVTLADDAAVTTPKLLTLDAIEENSFIGAAAIEEEGKLVALEVLVFPEAARGMGEGHYPWDLEPGSNMTNATVEDVAPEGDQRLVKVTYPDGEKDILVPSDIPVWTFENADRSALGPGLYAFIAGTKNADGSYGGAFVIVEKDGVKPPN